MSIGTLRVRMLVDDAERVRYGPNDAVSGKIIITFHPSTKVIAETNAELFGPLQITVQLHGRSKTKVSRKSGHTYNVYRGRVALFSHSVTVYDDSFKSQPGEDHEFPFEIYFPESLESSAWDYDYGFVTESALPPSFSERNFGLQSQYESFIEYRVGVDVVMEGLKISISKLDDEIVIPYERSKLLQPFVDKPSQSSGFVSISNELLLPEEDRPSGFKQKAKGKAMAVFSSEYYPKYTFDWKCFGPEHLYCGQPINFQVHIAPRESECTAAAIPEVYMSAFSVQIHASTSVRAEKRFLTTPESRGQSTLATLKGFMTDMEPFSKASDWMKNVVTDQLPDIPSTFKTVNIARRYMVQFNLVFKLAGKQRDFSESYEVFIHPPLLTVDSGVVVASSSAGPVFEREMRDPGLVLPQYEHPPKYNEEIKNE